MNLKIMKEARQRKSTLCMTPFICNSRRHKLIYSDRKRSRDWKRIPESWELTILIVVVVSHVYTCQQASEPYTSKMSSLLYVDYISKHVKQESPAISDSPSAYPFSLELVPVGPLPHHPQDQPTLASVAPRTPPSPGLCATSLLQSSPLHLPASGTCMAFPF